ncbi:MAG: TonB-dependent receptor [Desulfobacteraceae bacterium]
MKSIIDKFFAQHGVYSGGRMIDCKKLFKINNIMLILALVVGLAETGESGSRSSDADRAVQLQTESNTVPPWQTDTDHDSLELAMNDAGEEDRQQLQELLAVLDEETEVATKTRMNNDYVPGMVTVLHGDQLEALGAYTVAEALAMVPGIQVARLSTGEPTLKVRGVAFPFNAGNVKVMLNSIALSRESSGINSSVLLTPLAQVDRIEVIRGPGSSIYGDFAMAGVVNIITKNSGSRLFGRGGDDLSRSGGGQYNYRDDTLDFGLGVNISAADDGENATDLGRNPDEERYTGVFNLDYKNFSFTAEGVRRRVEYRNRALSAGGPPPPSNTGLPYAFREEESWAMEGRQTIALGTSATLDAHLSYLKNRFEGNEPAFVFNGDRVETGLDLAWSPWHGHQVLFSVSYADSDIDEASQEGPPGIGTTVQVSGMDRNNFSLGLQDQVALNARFSITLGFRYDDYDDVGSLVTPRIAAVYRLGEHHVVKAQYAQGFRTPTFWELYETGRANENLDFEIMSTTELSYIYRRPGSVGRLTLYSSKIDDGIYQDPTDGFGNIIEIESKGVEVEWEQQLGEKFRWQANLSCNDTWDGRSSADGHEPAGIAAWLGNLAVFVQPAAKLMLTARWLHVGERYTPDGRVGGYDTVDLTVSRTDLWSEGLTLRLGVKNLLDDEIVYLTDRISGLVEDQFPGRTWWLQLSYDF